MPSTYAVTDQDGSVSDPDGYDDTTYTYSVSGADGDDFSFDSGTLAFITGHEPDFEDQSSYSITVEAHSGEGARRLSASLDVIIEVVDGDDAGAVVLSQRQPEVGIAIHATASDDDGGVTIRKWVWELSEKVVRLGQHGDAVRKCQDDPHFPHRPRTVWTAIAGARVGGLRPEGGRRGQVPAGHGDLRRQRRPRFRRRQRECWKSQWGDTGL